MRKILLFCLGTLTCFSASADKVTTANFTSLSAAQKAAATEVVLTGTLSTSGNSDFRQLRDLAWQMASLNLQTANCTDIPKNALHSRHLLKTLVLPRLVKTIGEEAFFACDGLTGTVQLPINLTSVGYAAFANCKSIETLTITTRKLNYLGSYAFANCKSITGTVVIPSSLRVLRSGNFQNCSSLTGINLPDELLEIQDAVFAGCSSLTGNLNLGDYISSIGASAFEDCGALQGTLKLPRALQILGASAFRGCAGLTGKLYLPATLTHIGSGAFAGCSGLKQITIESGITSIPAMTFSKCTGLTTVSVINTVPPTADASAFRGVDCKNCRLLVPTGSAEAYRNAPVWKDFNIEEDKALAVKAAKEASNPFVSARNGQLIVKDVTAGTQLQVFAIDGVQVFSQTLGSASCVHPLPATGIYIVRLNNKEYKVENP